MKKLLCIISLFASVESFAAPWDIISIQQHVKTLPNVVYNGAYVWNKSYTPSGKDELVITFYFDDFTGNYTSRATVSVYGYYKHTQLGWPQVYWEWGYKQFTIDIPPNSHDYGQSVYVLKAGETFNMSGVSTADGQGEALYSGLNLISFVEL